MQRSIRFTKRLIDLFISTTGVLCAAPLMSCIAIAIKTGSRGPIIYKQERAGMIPADSSKGGDSFWIYKFRTMVQDAEKTTGAVLASSRDPRVTRLGQLLRKTRLDELPQLFNVMKGEMSIVGPRPERPEILRTLSSAIPFFEERMRLVKPGITGLAQIKLSYTGRLPENSELGKLTDSLLNPYGLPETLNSTADDMRVKLLFDLAYSASLEKFSSFLKTDLEIILKTPLVMFVDMSGQ
ncbi:MAG: glycosyl transferase [Deltaproteobacteria bacterium]|nr:glycosyl transferase [Deltaproteobacteria bacterium]